MSSQKLPLVQEDAAIATAIERAAHADYWKEQHDKLTELIARHGAEILGEGCYEDYRRTGAFYRDVWSMLKLANDVFLTRDRPELSQDGFAVVKGLIERALGQG